MYIALFLIYTAITSFQIQPVLADVPSVLGIEPWTSGTDTVLNITVRHSFPTSSHYVNKVEVETDENVIGVDLTPQSTVTFVVQYNMGEVADTPTVEARAHCNLHGLSSWSEPIVVPEFSIIALLLILITVSIAVIFLRKKCTVQTRKKFENYLMLVPFERFVCKRQQGF